MRNESRTMTGLRLMVATMLALAATAAPLGAAARAQAIADDGRPSVAAGVGEVSSAADEADRWWGAAGAIICGAEARLIRVAPTIGMNPYLIAAGLAGCALAAMDIMSTR